ncbi:hypothetical protein AD998_13395 [bacterium 336/3]|nr:hypothetical protein AD998_13395 [bacterium 336/3]
MKKSFFVKGLFAFSLITFLGGVPTHAQLMKKMKEKEQKKQEEAKKKQEEARQKAEEAKIAELTKPYAQDFTDETGISGTYYALKGIQFNKTVFQKTLKLQFLAKENGKVVNKLNVYYNKDGGFNTPYLDEKMKEKNITMFKCSDCNQLFYYSSYVNSEFYQPEAGVVIVYEDNAKKVVDVWAKDKAKLEVYDLETAQAKYDQFKKQADSEKFEQKKKSLMSNYPTYKENIGKVVFVDNFGVFNYQYTDQPKEDSKSFVKSQSMGKSIYWGAYLPMPMTVTCGNTCLRNMEYEMEGIKTSREELRNKSRKWSDMIKEKPAEDRFCLNNGFQLISHRENIWDYAYIYVLYQNREKFQLGKSYKLTARLYSHKDGANVEKVAEGSIMLVYDQDAKKELSDIFTKFEQFLNE